VTARRWLDPDGQDGYERAVAAVIDRIQAQSGFRVILIPQVTSSYRGDDDRTVGRRIAEHCRGEQPTLVEWVGDHRYIKATYSELDFMIGTRFHSVIFSLTSGVPCIAIEYEHKSRGIMRELELEHWVLAIADVTEERLGNLFDEMVRERDAYRNHLTNVMPQYVRRANDVTGMLAAAWKNSQAVRTAERQPGDLRLLNRVRR
jgi:colanic acid/amylovoran biosynthesis protein